MHIAHERHAKVRNGLEVTAREQQGWVRRENGEGEKRHATNLFLSTRT